MQEGEGIASWAGERGALRGDPAATSPLHIIQVAHSTLVMQRRILPPTPFASLCINTVAPSWILE